MNHRFATLRANLLYQLHGAKSPSRPCWRDANISPTPNTLFTTLVRRPGRPVAGARYFSLDSGTGTSNPFSVTDTRQ